ncbi:MAG: HlyD family efflux transporter periplasmic adaptor subunit [Bacteriovoracaceae bacterium]|jgi:putative peptide zinc metalloprotease protein|nr:HlyD family efflux transporter periplasmic adaptor subunit [Bacteriovoracaceae bacterium]
MEDKSKDFKKYPKLREDLKISQIKRSGKVGFIVKEPMSGEFYKFESEEWEIIELFNGENTIDDMVEIYNKKHKLDEIEAQALRDFQDGLDGMSLLVKSKVDTNVMLIEKMKEMRKSQLLSKKGSIMYKRFPLVDPDKWMDRVTPKITWLWTKYFLFFSMSVMLGAVFIMINNWAALENGTREIFTFSEMSWQNMAILWIVVYATIGIHELGHGLTCKFYGGEVHEIGFLLLFGQPCLYCNVNDAWLFDKKWKQVMVTIAGGYIEFFIGAVCTYIWYFSNPNTFINLISFQVMIICSISTILFNFNPLIKLDGYYLLSDFVEVPNLKEDCFTYLKYLAKKYVFRMDEPDFEATSREKFIYFAYGICSFGWMFGLLTGLFFMAQGMLVDSLNEFGVLISLFIGWKIAGGYVDSIKKFGGDFIMKNIAWFSQKKNQFKVGAGAIALVALFFIPIKYKIYGECELAPKYVRVVRAETDGVLTSWSKDDGDFIINGETIANVSNFTTNYGRGIASLAYEKQIVKHRKVLIDNPQGAQSEKKELASKKSELELKEREVRGLTLKYQGPYELATLNCPDSAKTLGSFVKKGDELCQVHGVKGLRAKINVTEQQVRFLEAGQDVQFKLYSKPYFTYFGKVKKINQSTRADPKNPKRKFYVAELLISNPGELKSGMSGKAKIMGENVSIIKYLGIKIVENLRMDLFF